MISVFFLKTDEISGRSIYADHWQEIMLSSYEKISDTQIKITLAPVEFVAAARFYEFADQKKNLKISKAVLSFAMAEEPAKRRPPRDPASGMATGRRGPQRVSSRDFGVPYHLSEITVTTPQLCSKGTLSFILTGTITRPYSVRDAASGRSTNRRIR